MMWTERIRNINMSGWNWVDSDFSGLRNLQTKFSASNMLKCLFVGSYLSGLVLKSNNVVSCDFSKSDISSSHIKSSNIVGSYFKNCNKSRNKRRNYFDNYNFSIKNYIFIRLSNYNT